MRDLEGAAFPSTTTACPRSLGDPRLRRALVSLVRRTVPEREVEDIVQETLLDALAAKEAPQDPRVLRSWASGIARHKVVDFHRKARREQLGAVPDAATEEAEAPWDLLGWARRALPGGRGVQKAFEWMLREGQGEKLEAIAESERLPPATVRQRVARLRRHLRERWAAELAAAVAVSAAITLTLLGLLLRRAPPVVRDETPAVEPSVVRGKRARAEAMERCRTGDARACLDGLDRAALLDPDGDREPDVLDARRRAAEQLAPPPAPEPTPAPSAGAAPPRWPDTTNLPSDTAPRAPHRCVCAKGDPLCSCL